MKAIQEEEADYENYPIPKFYHFKSRDARERILYANFNQVERDVKNMVAAIFEKEKAKSPQESIKNKIEKDTNSGKNWSWCLFYLRDNFLGSNKS